MKYLIRVCCNSEAYALSALPTESKRDDHQSFSRYYPRRLQAEVLLDAISQALGVPTEFPGGPGNFPIGTRAIDLPDEAVPNAFLDLFGRPARSSSCECERVGEASLGQALALIGSPIIEQKLTAKTGYVSELVADNRPADVIVNDIFMRILARPAPGHESDPAIGAGAFVPIDFETDAQAGSGERFRFRPNPFYFRGAPPLQRLTVKVIRDDNARLVFQGQGGKGMGMGPRYTVVETQGHNLLVTDNSKNMVYFYTVDKDEKVGSDLKLRASVDLTQVGESVIKIKAAK